MSIMERRNQININCDKGNLNKHNSEMFGEMDSSDKGNLKNNNSVNNNSEKMTILKRKHLITDNSEKGCFWKWNTEKGHF